MQVVCKSFAPLLPQTSWQDPCKTGTCVWKCAGLLRDNGLNVCPRLACFQKKCTSLHPGAWNKPRCCITVPGSVCVKFWVNVKSFSPSCLISKKSSFSSHESGFCRSVHSVRSGRIRGAWIVMNQTYDPRFLKTIVSPCDGFIHFIAVAWRKYCFRVKVCFSSHNECHHLQVWFNRERQSWKLTTICKARFGRSRHADESPSRAWDPIKKVFNLLHAASSNSCERWRRGCAASAPATDIKLLIMICTSLPTLYAHPAWAAPSTCWVFAPEQSLLPDRVSRQCHGSIQGFWQNPTRSKHFYCT